MKLFQPTPLALLIFWKIFVKSGDKLIKTLALLALRMKLGLRFFMERFIFLLTIAMAMVTTIQLQETTKQLLEKLKATEKAESFDELIRRLVESRVKVKDMFGFTSKKPLKFSRKDEMDFNEL